MTRRSPANRNRKQIRKPTLAERADRYVLYQHAVQDATWEIQFMAETYHGLRGRSPRRLREDFCGTALFACAWVKSQSDREAVGIDLDPEVLAWSRAHNVPKLSPAMARRLTLIEGDVLEARSASADLVCAFNFSYWIFRERATLRRYFESVRAGLAADGIFMLDAYGGYDAYKVQREREDMGRFTYIWDQADYDPVTLTPPATSISPSPTAPGSTRPSVTTGASGACPNCRKCWRKPVSSAAASTGRAPTPRPGTPVTLSTLSSVATRTRPG